MLNLKVIKNMRGASKNLHIKHYAVHHRNVEKKNYDLNYKSSLVISKESTIT